MIHIPTRLAHPRQHDEICSVDGDRTQRKIIAIRTTPMATAFDPPIALLGGSVRHLLGDQVAANGRHPADVLTLR